VNSVYPCYSSGRPCMSACLLQAICTVCTVLRWLQFLLETKQVQSLNAEETHDCWLSREPRVNFHYSYSAEEYRMNVSTRPPLGSAAGGRYDLIVLCRYRLLAILITCTACSTHPSPIPLGPMPPGSMPASTASPDYSRCKISI
jgi:hypothetical protein